MLNTYMYYLTLKEQRKECLTNDMSQFNMISGHAKQVKTMVV